MHAQMVLLSLSLLVILAVHTAHAFGGQSGWRLSSFQTVRLTHCAHRHRTSSRPSVRLFEKVTDEELGLKKVKIGDQDFWTRQKELITELQDESEKRVKATQRVKFAQRRLALVGDTAYFGFFIFCGTYYATILARNECNL